MALQHAIGGCLTSARLGGSELPYGRADGFGRELQAVGVYIPVHELQGSLTIGCSATRCCSSRMAAANPIDQAEWSLESSSAGFPI